MIQHVVLFRPKQSLSDADRQALIVALQDAISGIPDIRHSTIGRRVLLNRPGYEQQMAEHYEYSAVIEFDSESGLRAYLDHPVHVDLGRRLFEAADALLAYDFAAVSPGSLGNG